MVPEGLTSSIIQLAVAIPFALLGALSLNLIVMWTIRPIVGGRRRPPTAALPDDGDLPGVLIQLPVYNEPNVVARLLRAVASLDWPRALLRIQLLDDSTDGTGEVAAALVEALHVQGFAIAHIRRTDRRGYKAGALANGLARDDSPFVAMFDADFMPPPDFLKCAMRELAGNRRLAFVQARWEHLNADENPLTMAQAMMIDAHFMVEQRVRSQTCFILPFNGTCGIWRRTAIDEAAGWSADTLCEDLDLSIRTRLAGWDALLLDHVAVPGELPATLGGWRAQQFRWTKGFIQVARKLFTKVWTSDLPIAAKLAFTMQTCQPLCYPLTILSLLGTLVLLLNGDQGAYELSLLGGAVAVLGIGASALCLATGSLALKRGHWARLPFNIAIILLLNAGLMVSNTRAVLEGLAGANSPFVRTPKQGATGIGGNLDKLGPTGAAELISGGALGLALAYEAGWASPLFSLSITGLILMGVGLARERWLAAAKRTAFWRAAARTADQPAE